MTCERCGPLLSLYHDGMLEPKQREDMRAHLQRCPECTAQLARYTRIDAQIAQALRVTPSPRFSRAVLAATSAKEMTVALHARRRRSARRRVQVLLGSVTGASAAALIALALGVASGMTPLRPAQHGNLAQVVRTSVPMTTESPLRDRATGTAAAMPSVTRDILRARVATRMPAWISTRPATPPPARRHLAEATITAVAAPADQAALLHISAATPLNEQDAGGPLWSWDSRSLLYRTNQRLDALTGWYVYTLMRYSPTGTITIHDLVQDFAWSPDDRGIVYTAQAPDAGTTSDLAQDLHVVHADGSGDRVLGRVDRASVEYLTGHITAVRQGRLVAINPASGASAPLDALPPLRIAAEDSAFWALSAGERFFAYQDGSGLRVWDRQHGGRLVLRNDLARFGQASFHFTWDGTAIFYSTFDGNYTMLYQQSLDPPGDPRALNDGKPLHGPILQVGSPSPDGSMVNFRTGQNNTAISYLIDARQGPAHRLLPPNGVGVGPVSSWSPDGTRFVYTVYRDHQAVGSAIARVTR
jgi:hypothetical protein